MQSNVLSSPILITGGTQRLGLAIAEHYLELGYPLIITYRTPKPSVDYLKDRGADLIQCDFEQDDSVDRLIALVNEKVHTLRGIIHNASDWDAEHSDQANIDLLNKMINIHVSAPYKINWSLKEKLIQHHLVHNEFSDIIHMTDYVAETGSAKHVAYSASKAALHNLTLSFAKKLAPKVKVNSIAPALVMFNDEDDEAYRSNAKHKSLLQAVPGPQEAVKAVSYLFESDYVTGQTLHLNGGRHLKLF